MAVYAMTDSNRVSGVTPGKRYLTHPGETELAFIIYSDIGEELYCLWEGCAHLGCRGSWTRIEEEERVTLREGDYVSTDGMTEDQYHTVARAFMAAGAASGEYPNYSFADEDISCARWSFGNRRGALFHGLSGCFDGRHLTPAQVIGAVNAKRQPIRGYDVTLTITREEDSALQYRAAQSPFFSDGSIVEVHEYDTHSSSLFRLVSGECRYNNAGGMPGAWDSFNNMELINMNDNMTPCEKMGYKVGDRFVAKGGAMFDDGSVVELYRDDSSVCPLWKLISGKCQFRNADRKPGAYEGVQYFEKIDHEEKQDMLTAILEAAETTRENADQHQALADQASGEHDRLMQRARDMLPDGGGW